MFESRNQIARWLTEVSHLLLELAYLTLESWNHLRQWFEEASYFNSTIL